MPAGEGIVQRAPGAKACLLPGKFPYKYLFSAVSLSLSVFSVSVLFSFLILLRADPAPSAWDLQVKVLGYLVKDCEA